MLRAVALSTLLLLVPAVGCLGGQDTANGEEAARKARAEVTDDRGGIEGTVTDPAVQPVPGATVTLVELSRTATTAADGSFAFSNVLPGDYRLTVVAEGFVGAAQEIQVRSGDVSVVDVILAHVPSIVPFSQQREFTGFVECSVRAGVGFAACGAVNLVAGGNATNDRFLFTWPVEPDPWQMVAEIEWDANQPLGTALDLIVEPEGIPNEGQTFYGEEEGESPLVVTVDRARFEEVDANMTAICEGEKEPQGSLAPSEPDAYCRPPLVEEGGIVMARIFVNAAVDVVVPEQSPALGGANFGPGFAFQQDYHVIVTMFHHAPACEDYSLFAGTDCPQEDTARAPGPASGNATGNETGNETG